MFHFILNNIKKITYQSLNYAFKLQAQFKLKHIEFENLNMQGLFNKTTEINKIFSYCLH